MENDQYRAEKVTVTFRDGHTEDHDVFILVVACGLLPIGQEDNGRRFYMAGEDFGIKHMVCAAATPEVIAGLMQGALDQVSDIASKASPEILAAIMAASCSMCVGKTTEVSEVESVYRDPSNN